MPDKAGDHAVAADAHVVRDLDQIVDLGVFADNRVGHGATVDGGIGADLDIVLDNDAADLRNALGPRAGDEAETVLADLGAGVDDHAVADERVLDVAPGPT